MSTAPPVLEYRPNDDVIVIQGISYARSLFDTLAFGPVPKYLRLDQRADGKIVFTGFSKELEAKFNQLAGIK